MGLLAAPADHVHGSGPSPEVYRAVRTKQDHHLEQLQGKKSKSGSKQAGIGP